MKRILLFLPVFFMFLINTSATDIPGGDVSGTWTKANSPYNIYGDVSVPENQVLVIEPGVEVIFRGHYRITMYKSDLFAVGTPGEMILFTMADTNGLVAGGEDDGGWNGLKFVYSSVSGDTSRLEYCRFEYAKVREVVSGGMGTIGTERIPRLLVANCVFEDNYSDVSGIDCRLADVVIRNNTFRNNVGQSLVKTSQANPFLYNNRVEDNTFISLVYVYSWCFPYLEKNIIKNNQVRYVVYANGDNASPTLVNNMIINNTVEPGKQTIYLNDSDAKFYGNLIANNDGGGLRIFDGNPEIIQNTIVNNLGTYALYVNTNEGVFNGNIVVGNSDQVYYNKRTKEPSFIHNLIEGGIDDFVGDPFTGIEHDNLDDLPLFVNATFGPGPAYDAEIADFNLLANSPAINNGDPSLNEENLIPMDIYGNDRVKYSFIDIGAAEASTPSMSIGPVTYSSDQTLIGDTIFVNGNIVIDDDVVVKIAGGCRIIFEGPYYIDVNGTLLAEGTASDSIRFTVRDTSGFSGTDYNAGCWKGINIIDHGSIDDNVPSFFNHCIFEFAKTNTSDGAVLSLSSIPEFQVSNSVFRHNRGSNGRAVLSCNYSNMNIDHCLVESNYSIDVGYASGAFDLYESDVSITRSVFRNNTGAYGVCLYLRYCSLYSAHNVFHNNRPFSYGGYGTVLYATNSECTIVNDLAINNNSNTGAYDFSSAFVSITNTTIANNLCNNFNFAGGIGLTRTELVMTNSILYGNRADGDESSIFLFEENTDPDLYNCLIENGSTGIRTYSGFSFTGEYVNCLDQQPHFILPSTGSGADYDVTGTDWQLLDISPAINTGTTDTSGLGLLSYDLAGNPRIIGSRVDIGAYEKTGHPPVVTTDPQGGNYCTGDRIELVVEYSNTDTALIQWKKDGTVIPGATDNVLTIDPAELSDEGNYVCVLSNTYGSVNSVPVFLNVKAPPEILVEPDISWVQPDIPLNLSVLVNGSSPMHYQWKKNGADIPGAVLPEYKFVPADSSYEGQYTCVISNACGEETTTPVDLLLAPQICMVTVDSATGKNLVIWEKKTHAPILAYNIYRETQAAGIYDILGTVPFDQLSEFTDSTADPTVQAYLYKITAVDMSGVETDADLCKPHKTIHLLVSTNPEFNTTQLAWDKYYGFDYQTYVIYRSNDGMAFDSVHSIASTLNSWTDPLPVAGDLYYRIAVQKPEPCHPTGGNKKAGVGVYTHSLSNLDDNKLKAGEAPPDSILLDNYDIDENAIPGMLVGRLSTIDPDSGDFHSYQLVSGTGDNGNSSFTIVGDLFLSAVTFDYESQSSYSVRIRSTDMASNYVEDVLIITINDTDESAGGPGTGATPPDTIMLDRHEISENNSIGALVARLSTSDPDTFDMHTYQLVPGEGDDDNLSFSVYGDMLLAAEIFDFEQKSSYSIRIRSTDRGWNHIESAFEIVILDVDETVGISGHEVKTLRIYPNPFHETTRILFPNPDAVPYRMYLSDLSGKIVRIRENIAGNRFTLHREGLAKGYYILELRGDQIYRGRIIVE